MSSVLKFLNRAVNSCLWIAVSSDDVTDNSQEGFWSAESCSVFQDRKIKEVKHRFTCHVFSVSKYDAHALVMYSFQSPHLLMTEGQIVSHAGWIIC